VLAVLLLWGNCTLERYDLAHISVVIKLTIGLEIVGIQLKHSSAFWTGFIIRPCYRMAMRAQVELYRKALALRTFLCVREYQRAAVLTSGWRVLLHWIIRFHRQVGGDGGMDVWKCCGNNPPYLLPHLHTCILSTICVRAIYI
jgi:hypothetical protein